jgi:hypothetical protein
LLLFTVTLPKARLAVVLSCPGVVPVPDSGIARVGLEPSDVRDTVPVALPLTSGANATPNVNLWAGARVSGTVKPLTLKPAPVVLA